MPPTRKPYSGAQKKLVLAFDVGTTFSGISYCLLDPGHVPEISGVTRYPAQKSGGDSKIPTIIYYDQAGNVRSCGAEAKQPNILEQVITENWVLAEWFKLHMRPQSISESDTASSLPDLPPGKSAIDVLADFIRYLHRCAKEFIQETHANGEVLWETVKNEIDYVLSHPNGWEGSQQQQIRNAAVKAGLIPNTPEGQKRIRLVTEGEASLHFCIQKGLTADPMKNGAGILIVDAGGGTVDISAYGEASNMKFQEIAAPTCYLQGSVFVTTRAKSYLDDYLKNSRYREDVDEMKSEFDQSAKLTFENKATPLYIRFGRPRDFDPQVNIRAGQLCLSGNDVANFFQPSIDCIVNAIVDQRRKASKRIASVFLVGGFSANRFLFSQIKDAPALADIDVCRPDCHLNKAVADGALSFYLDGYVNVRVSKFAYGIKCNVPYDNWNSSHRERLSKVYFNSEGVQRVPDAFDTILPQGKQVSEVQEFRRSYNRFGNQPYELRSVTEEIVAYRGASAPQWMDGQETANYTTLCYVEADTSQLCGSLKPQRRNKRKFYKMTYDIIMSFGLTEFKAQIAWKQNGVEIRGPVKVVYDALA